MAGSKLPLAIIFITVFIDLLGFGIVLPLLPRYAEAYHATDLQLGLLSASFSAMQSLFAPLWGRLSDRIGRRPILLLGLLGSTLSYALFSYVSSFETNTQWLGLSILNWMFVSRIAAGIAGATIPTALAYIADCTGSKERGKGMALIGFAFGIGFVFGPLIGVISLGIKNGPDWHPGAVASGLSALAFLFAYFKLPEPTRVNADATAEAESTAQASSLGRPDLLLLLFTMFLTTFAFAQFETTLSRLTEVMGVGTKSNYYVFAVLGVVLLFAQGFLVRRLLPKLGEYRMASIGAVLMAVGLTLIGVAGAMKSMNQLYLSMSIAVCGFAALNPSLQSSLSLRVSSRDQGRIMGFGQSANAAARVLGPVIGNPIFGWYHPSPYFSGGLLMIIGLVCVLMTGRNPHEESGKPADVPPELH